MNLALLHAIVGTLASSFALASPVTATLPVAQPFADASPPAKKPATRTPAQLKVLALAQQLIIPQVQFQDATLDEALEYIRVKARDLDPATKGINIVLKPSAELAKARITLSLKDVPVLEALRYITELAGCKLDMLGESFYIAPLSDGN